MTPERTSTTTRHIPRRTFIAATALSVPAVAAAHAAGAGLMRDEDTQFAKHMQETGGALKAMRKPMRTVDDPASRAQAAMLANTITIHLASAVKTAHQADIPSQAKAKYAGDHDRFVHDMRLDLTKAVSAANALSRQLWLGNTEESVSLFNELRASAKDGHGLYKQDD